MLHAYMYIRMYVARWLDETLTAFTMPINICRKVDFFSVLFTKCILHCMIFVQAFLSELNCHNNMLLSYTRDKCLTTLQDPNRLYSTADSVTTSSSVTIASTVTKHSKYNIPTIKYELVAFIDTQQNYVLAVVSI